MLIADVILEQTAFSFDKPYGYAIPESIRETVKSGCRVVVPFGKGNTHRQAVVLSIYEDRNDIPYKEIYRLIDETPILTEEMLSMVSWMHEHCFCTYFDAVKAVLPTGISFTVKERLEKGDEPFEREYSFLEEYFTRCESASREEVLEAFETLSDNKINNLIKTGQLKKISSATRKMNDSTLKTVRPLLSEDELCEIKLTPRQLEIARLVLELGSVSVKELVYFTGVSASVITALADKGVIEIFEQEVYRRPINEKSVQNKEIMLTDEQQSAYNELSRLHSSNKGEAALLYGVTGSGKTSVFLKLVDKAVAEGKGAIILVPEISLTPQTVEIFAGRYGKKVALFHSALSLGQRMDEWKRVKNGEATVAIGTRSAIFAPVKNLSLIIIDEEQEHTYKSEQSPRFHTRDLAKFRVAFNKALLVLASATPSLETYTNAKIGKYSLCKLTERYGNAHLPEVITVDMRKRTSFGKRKPTFGRT